ncbi:MAG: EAL domain-containing response regulator [Pseudomonadota bacterium]|nr:EAL domain-containing response regulator [Pseudomonadota bacterium]
MADRMLIVDDQPEIASLVSSVARDCGYNVDQLHDNKQFAALVSDWQPTHLVIDLQMPDVDGIELLRLLAEQGSRARIIIMSGTDNKVIESARYFGRARGLDIVGMLRKPFRTAELRDIISRVRSTPTREDVPISARHLNTALDNDELWMAFQPKFRLGTERAGDCVSGAEALMRWTREDGTTISPAEFIPLAESAGIMDLLTARAIDKVLRQMAAWLQDGVELQVAINISAQNLHSATFTEDFASKCREYNISPSSVICELTETTTMQDPTQAMEALTRLRLKGFSLAIDDFGTGYSSLVILQKLPFSELKIDRAFVGDCLDSPQSGVIVRAMIDLAHNLGLSVVAEGAETGDVVEFLRNNGCDLVQGYFYSRPLKAEELISWISSARQC